MSFWMKVCMAYIVIIIVGYYLGRHWGGHGDDPPRGGWVEPDPPPDPSFGVWNEYDERLLHLLGIGSEKSEKAPVV